MKKSNYFIALLVAGVTFQACNNPESKDSVEMAEDANEMNDQNSTFDMSTTDDYSDFAVEATDDGLLEIELGKIAVSKANDAEVKEYAQMIVDDHTKVNATLKTIADSKSITLPPTPSNDHSKTLDDFNKKDAKDFDKDYIDEMVRNHESDIDFYEDAANDDDFADAELKAFAKETLPALRAHLSKAKVIQERLNK